MLINTARALDDIRFKWRVRAALLKTAALRKESELPEEVAYAENILQNPMLDAPQMEALCAVDIGVVQVVKVDEYNTVNTEDVKDATILYVVEANFTWMARQFTEGAAPNGTNASPEVWAVNRVTSTG